jgi:hypothetical protein
MLDLDRSFDLFLLLIIVERKTCLEFSEHYLIYFSLLWPMVFMNLYQKELLDIEHSKNRCDLISIFRTAKYNI